MALDPDIHFFILIAFLYLVLPVLVRTSVGVAAGIRFPQVGKLRGACLGLAVGALGIAANVGYGFLVQALWEWRYPSVVYLSETSARFQGHYSYALRDTALLSGPCLARCGPCSSRLARVLAMEAAIEVLSPITRSQCGMRDSRPPSGL